MNAKFHEFLKQLYSLHLYEVFYANGQIVKFFDGSLNCICENSSDFYSKHLQRNYDFINTEIISDFRRQEKWVHKETKRKLDVVFWANKGEEFDMSQPRVIVELENPFFRRIPKSISFCDVERYFANEINSVHRTVFEPLVHEPEPYELFYINSPVAKFFDENGTCRTVNLFEFVNTIEFKTFYEVYYAHRPTQRRLYKCGEIRYKHRRGTSGIIVKNQYEYRGKQKYSYIGSSIKQLGKPFGDDGSKLRQLAYTAKDGETLKEFLKRANTKPNDKLSEVEVYITKIYSPDFRRSPENQSKNTFDTIFIQCNTNTHLDVSTFIKTNKKEVINHILNYLENHRSFKKYGIPINFLRITSAKYHKKLNLLDFIFELKPIGKENNAINETDFL